MESQTGIQWELLSEVYHPDEARLISGLLTMAGIPVKLEREAIGELYALTVGTLGRIRIFVQEGRSAEAEKILTEGSEPFEDLAEE